MLSRFNLRKPRYNDDSDYTTNASSYYDDLARKNKLIEILANKIWDYEKTLDNRLDDMDNVLTNRLDDISIALDNYIHVVDGKIELIDHKIGEGFNDEIDILLREWVNDGTLNHIINEEIFDTKVDADVFNYSINNLSTRLEQNENATKFYFNNSKPKMVAHRGAMGYAPENTIPAYELAGQMGYWGVECDILPSSDGEMFLMHDNTLDRTTDGSGIIWEKTTAQIKQLTVTGGSNIEKFPGLKIPTLDEFLAVCKKWGMVPLIEIKAYHFAWEYDYIVNAIKKAGLEDMSIVISVNFEILRQIRARSKRITLQAIKFITEENIETCLEIGNCGIDVDYADLTKEKVELAHSKGLHVNTWVANTPQEKKRALDCGVDMISTDYLL